jgi:hypothetical protein
MNTIYNVVINGDTTGTIDSDTIDGQHASSFVGEVIRIKSRDENGMYIELEGVLTEVLA